MELANLESDFDCPLANGHMRINALRSNLRIAQSNLILTHYHSHFLSIPNQQTQQTQAWIQNLTVRQCILFGKPYDRSKYRATLAAAQLKKDLENLPAGDGTEIGERGTFVRRTW